MEVNPEDTVTDPTDTCKRAPIPFKTGEKVHPAVTLILLGIGLEAILPVTTIDVDIGAKRLTVDHVSSLNTVTADADNTTI